jgi:hypothetical protein
MSKTLTIFILSRMNCLLIMPWQVYLIIHQIVNFEATDFYYGAKKITYLTAGLPMVIQIRPVVIIMIILIKWSYF